MTPLFHRHVLTVQYNRSIKGHSGLTNSLFLMDPVQVSIGDITGIHFVCHAEKEQCLLDQRWVGVHLGTKHKSHPSTTAPDD